MAVDHYYMGPPGEMTHHYVPPTSIWTSGRLTSLPGPQPIPVVTQPYVPNYFPPAITPPPPTAAPKPIETKVGEWIRISQCPKCGMPHWCRPADDAAASPETVKTCSCGFY